MLAYRALFSIGDTRAALPTPKPVRRHRAGRNVQLSLKVSAGVKEQFTAVAAAHGFAFGELLERALDAFVREAKRW